MNFLLFLFLSAFLLLVYKGLKNTVFGINRRTGNYLGFFVFYDLVIYIIPSLLLLNLFPIEDFWVAFKVKQDSIVGISLLVVVSMILYFISLKILSRGSQKLFIVNNEKLMVSNNKRITSFFRLVIVICVLLMLGSYVIFGIGHSFSMSFASETSISSLRFGIGARSETKVIKHLFIFITPILTVILGSGIYRNNKFRNGLSLLLIFIIASWGGSKGPVLTVIIVYVISKLSFNKTMLKIKLKTFFLIIILIFTLVFLSYRIVLFQYPQLDGNLGLFLNYFLQRIFVAQMIGTYEQFNLLLHDIKYIYHGIPFASSFVDFPVFHKDLMLISEDRYEAGNIGIKNTLFISEAYAMGGITLLLISPFWMAIVYAINYRIMVFITNKYIFRNLEYTKTVMAISVFSYVSITGGFSDLMLFKITILMVLLLAPFFLVNWFLNLKKK